MDKVLLHKNLVLDLNTLYERKNADYGDSFAQARAEVPYYTLGKLYDKFSRYKNIVLSGEATKVDETIEDTLLDMANYCIMEVLERRSEKAEEFVIGTLDGRKITTCKSDGDMFKESLENAFNGR